MNVSKQFAKFVSQNILGTLGVSCYIIADTFFISLMAGANGITVLNLALPIYNFMFAIGAMIGIGSATKFSILRAQKDARSDNYMFNSIVWLAIFSLIFVFAGLFAPDSVMRLMGADEQIVALGIGYFRIFLLFAPFFMINYVFTAFVRNDNDPSLAMLATVTSSLANVVFDYIFMFPMKMGLSGAALATAASPIISILICSLHFRKKTNTLKLIPKMPSIKRTAESAQLGVPAFIAELSSGITTMIFNFLILGIAGNIGVAAYGVVANFALVAIAMFNGIFQGSQPLISKYYGEGDEQATRKVLKLGVTTALTIAAVMYVVVFCFTDVLVDVFNSEHSVEMAAYAFDGMRLYFIGFFFAGVNIVVSGFLSATEKVVGSFIISILRGVAAIVFFAFILAHFFGFTGVWVSFAAAEAFTTLAAILCLTYKRK